MPSIKPELGKPKKSVRKSLSQKKKETAAKEQQSAGTGMIIRDLTELKRTEDETESLAKFPDENPNPIIRIGDDGRILYANKVAGLLIQNFGGAVGRPAPALLRDLIAQALASQAARAFEVEHDARVYAFDVVPITKSGYINVYGRDITDRKQGEKALRENEANLTALVENTKDRIWAVDADYRLIVRNPQFLQGAREELKREIALGESVLMDSLPQAVQGEWRSYYDRALRGESFSVEKETQFYKEPAFIDYRFHPIRSAEGKIIGVVVSGRDITERKRMEVELSQAEGNFRRSLDDSPLGISIISAEGETLYANRAILDLYGYDDVEELRSTPVKKRYTPASYTEFQLRKKKRMNGEDSPSKYEINIVKKTGEIRRLDVFRKEILWNGQKQFQAIYQDVTEQKKAADQLRETLEGLRDALGGIIQVLSAMTEKRDPYTAGHQRRVAELARAIGQEMGLAADRVEGLRMAGIIHDIGKVSIPAEILSKPTRLSEIEYKMIQSHAQVGHDILGEVKFAWPIAKMILQHHERMDGSGYPQGLKGDDILLESRILAVSDVVEAMVSHRPYRSAQGIEEALKEIENNKGLLYDPAVVSACLTLFREKGYTLNG
jgi:PAS domain S-box-containing protein/putative nucleotidyltransferase with HDIG domain